MFKKGKWALLLATSFLLLTTAVASAQMLSQSASSVDSIVSQSTNLSVSELQALIASLQNRLAHLTSQTTSQGDAKVGVTVNSIQLARVYANGAPVLRARASVSLKNLGGKDVSFNYYSLAYYLTLSNKSQGVDFDSGYLNRRTYLIKSNGNEISTRENTLYAGKNGENISIEMTVPVVDLPSGNYQAYFSNKIESAFPMGASVAISSNSNKSNPLYIVGEKGPWIKSAKFNSENGRVNLVGLGLSSGMAVYINSQLSGKDIKGTGNNASFIPQSGFGKANNLYVERGGMRSNVVVLDLSATSSVAIPTQVSSVYLESKNIESSEGAIRIITASDRYATSHSIGSFALKASDQVVANEIRFILAANDGVKDISKLFQNFQLKVNGKVTLGGEIDNTSFGRTDLVFKNFNLVLKDQWINLDVSADVMTSGFWASILGNKSSVLASTTLVSVIAVDSQYLPVEKGNLGSYVKYQLSYNPSPTAVKCIVGSKLGDINGDGKIDILDVTLVNNVANGSLKLSEYPCADLDNSGKVDVVDTQKINQCALSLSGCGIWPYDPASSNIGSTKPTASLTVTPNQITYLKSEEGKASSPYYARLTWTSTNAQSCRLTGGRFNNTLVATSQSSANNPIYVYPSWNPATYSLTCYSDTAGTLNPSTVSTVNLAVTVGAEAVYGDINGDGKVDAADVTIVTNCSLGMCNSDAVLKAKADVNKDGKVDVADITIVRNLSLKVSQGPSQIDQLAAVVASLKELISRLK